ncbi:MAG: hypothetical protein GC160_07905 [Acidobacteria bacterium]|nr:hypothetical protein [Acidobacteriota bacterium]
MFGRLFAPPLRLRVFGVGLPKTGTTSLAAMFAGHYRASHESGLQILPAVSAHLEGELSREQVFPLLDDRIEQLRLEVDVASYLGHFVEPLAERYPEARFVVTVRRCLPWVVSLANHMVGRPLKPGSLWKRYRDARFGRYDEPFAPEEEPLRELGLFPLRSLFHYWRDETERMLAEAPPDRTLVIKTAELRASGPRLSEFLAIPPETLQPVHANRQRGDASALTLIPDDFVLERAEPICGPLMARLYGPDWVSQTPPRLFRPS